MSSTEKVDLPTERLAYVAVLNPAGEYRLGIAKEGEQGYYTTKDGTTAGGTFESYKAASEAAKAFNDRLGLDAREAAMIVASTMFGGR